MYMFTQRAANRLHFEQLIVVNFWVVHNYKLINYTKSLNVNLNVYTL